MNSINKKKLSGKSLFLLLILLLTIIGLVVWSNDNQRHKILITKILTQVFTYPNASLKNTIDNLGSNQLIGNGVPDNPSNVSNDKLFEIYGSYFTKDAYADFCNKRYPFEIFLSAQHHSSNIEITNIEITRDNNTYNCSVTLSLIKNEAERNVVQDVYITFTGNKISNFFFDKNNILTAINEL